MTLTGLLNTDEYGHFLFHVVDKILQEYPLVLTLPTVQCILQDIGGEWRIGMQGHEYGVEFWNDRSHLIPSDPNCYHLSSTTDLPSLTVASEPPSWMYNGSF